MRSAVLQRWCSSMQPQLQLLGRVDVRLLSHQGETNTFATSLFRAQICSFGNAANYCRSAAPPLRALASSTAAFVPPDRRLDASHLCQIAPTDAPVPLHLIQPFATARTPRPSAARPEVSAAHVRRE